MPPQSISTLMVDADFGRILSSRELLLARSYRWLLFTLITALLIAHLPLTNSAAPIFVGLATLLAYITVRSRLSPRMEGYFYTPRPQLQFALFTVLGVTGMLVLLGLKGSEGVLWILYLPALLLVSFYARQSTYFVMVALVATMAAGTRYIELRNTSLPINPYGIPDTLVMACELFIRACAVVLASFLVHYLARVDLTVNYGSELRKKITHNLLQRILLETNGLALWGEIHKACDASTKADHSDLYLYDQEQQQLQEVKQGAHGGYVLGRIIDMTSDDIAARVIQSKEVIVIREKKPIGLAAPIYGPLGRDSNPLAVIILYINFSSERECLVTLSWLIDMLNDIQPIVTYATIYQQSLLPDSTDNDENYSLHLEEVLDRVVKTLCYKFGFSLAKISLFNEGRQELRAICSNGMQKGFGTDTRDWKEDQDTNDWDAVFDDQLWKAGEQGLVFISVPLGHLGAIEAGFYHHNDSDVPDLLESILHRYAYDITIEIRDAQLYEREQQQAATLRRLHDVGYNLQMNPEHHNEATLLKRVAEAALTLFQANTVRLYPVEYPLRELEKRFAPPICISEGDQRESMTDATQYDTITRNIAETCRPFYRPDPRNEPEPVITQVNQSCDDQRSTPQDRPVRLPQHNQPVACIPLLAHGKLLGVLCMDYRDDRRFSLFDQQMIEIFAQQAAAVIVSSHWVRERERRRIQRDLHDLVKSNVLGLSWLSNCALRDLDRDQAHVREHLKEVRRGASWVLNDISLIVNNLSPEGHDNQSLERLIHQVLDRIPSHDTIEVRVDLDHDLPALPMRLTRTLMCIMHEAVVNAWEHAKAHVLHVSVRCTGERVQLLVEDDGCGFDERIERKPGHCGLESMRERAEEIGGHLYIQTAIGHGTTILADLPRKEEGDGIY